ncbi:hypothetical protein B2J93_2948 [Marssonina coronariae]|uniref:Uncharacterized protein n=1 Tax=Diplocarpon coronariae TaxID=2795749 RepID=A0A218Z813_9HELO|nr:hypothetical protein B2J93_2948 [Marssonina coronariae]
MRAMLAGDRRAGDELVERVLVAGWQGEGSGQEIKVDWEGVKVRDMRENKKMPGIAEGEEEEGVWNEKWEVRTVREWCLLKVKGRFGSPRGWREILEEEAEEAEEEEEEAEANDEGYLAHHNEGHTVTHLEGPCENRNLEGRPNGSLAERMYDHRHPQGHAEGWQDGGSTQGQQGDGHTQDPHDNTPTQGLQITPPPGRHSKSTIARRSTISISIPQPLSARRRPESTSDQPRSSASPSTLPSTPQIHVPGSWHDLPQASAGYPSPRASPAIAVVKTGYTFCHPLYPRPPSTSNTITRDIDAGYNSHASHIQATTRSLSPSPSLRTREDHNPAESRDSTKKSRSDNQTSHHYTNTNKSKGRADKSLHTNESYYTGNAHHMNDSYCAERCHPYLPDENTCADRASATPATDDDSNDAFSAHYDPFSQSKFSFPVAAIAADSGSESGPESTIPRRSYEHTSTYQPSEYTSLYQSSDPRQIYRLAGQSQRRMSATETAGWEAAFATVTGTGLTSAKEIHPVFLSTSSRSATPPTATSTPSLLAIRRPRSTPPTATPTATTPSASTSYHRPHSALAYASVTDSNTLCSIRASIAAESAQLAILQTGVSAAASLLHEQRGELGVVKEELADAKEELAAIQQKRVAAIKQEKDEIAGLRATKARQATDITNFSAKVVELQGELAELHSSLRPLADSKGDYHSVSHKFSNRHLRHDFTSGNPSAGLPPTGLLPALTATSPPTSPYLTQDLTAIRAEKKQLYTDIQRVRDVMLQGRDILATWRDRAEGWRAGLLQVWRAVEEGLVACEGVDRSKSEVRREEEKGCASSKRTYYKAPGGTKDDYPQHEHLLLHRSRSKAANLNAGAEKDGRETVSRLEEFLREVEHLSLGRQRLSEGPSTKKG